MIFGLSSRTAMTVVHLGLILHTDGISSRFDLAGLPEFSDREPRLLAEALLERCARHSDDATIVASDTSAYRPRWQRSLHGSLVAMLI